MSNTILIKRSGTGGAIPASGNLALGELAINYTDGNLFYKNAGGTVTVIASNQTITLLGNVLAGNVNTGGVVSSAGNVIAGNVVTVGQVSATGNVTGDYFIGNGALLTGIDTSLIANGNSNVKVFANGNVAISATGTANIAVFSSSGEYVSGLLSVTGNAISGNVTTTGIANVGTLAVTGNSTLTGTLSITGNVTGGNISLTGNVATGGILTDNYYYANGSPLDFQQPAGSNTQLQFNNNNDFGASANLTFNSATNILSVGGNITGTGNVSGGNILAGTALRWATGNSSITDTGSITLNPDTAASGLNGVVIGGSGYLLGPNGARNAVLNYNSQSGQVGTYQLAVYGNTAQAIYNGGANTIGDIGNATGYFGNAYVKGVDATFLSASGNITGGNVNTTNISLTGNITGAGGTTSIDNIKIGFNTQSSGAFTDITASGIVSATGNITAGNVNTAIVSATGNVIAGNVTTTGIANVGTLAVTGNETVVGYLSVTGNITGGNLSTTGLINTSGNISGNNINAATLITSATLSATGNVIAGNISSSGNITGANVIAVTTVDSGNISHATAITIAPASGNIYLSPTSGNIVLDNSYINGVAYPLQDADAASKIYVDNMVSTGIAYHQPVQAATVTDLDTATGGTVSYSQPNGAGNGVGALLTTTGSFYLIDTSNVQTVGTRILVKNEANAVWNGVYSYANTTNLIRTVDTDSYGPDSTTDLSINDYFFVQAGNVNAGSAYVVSAPSGTITFGTSNITFTQFSSSQTYSANTAAGLELQNQTFNAKVDNNTTAFDVGGNIVVKASANLTTPNIGAATGTSLSVSGNVVAGNVNIGSGIVSTTGNINGGNVNTAIVSASGNITGANITTSGTANLATLLVTTSANITATTISTSTITGAVTIAGGLGVAGNIYGGALYDNGTAVLTINSTVDGGTY